MTTVTRPALRYHGGMSPPLFEQRGPFAAMWYWFHVKDCGTGYKALPVDRQPWPADLDWISMPAPRREHLTPSPQAAGIDRPSVGSMGARQPADAGPQGELFAEVAA